MPRNPTIGSVTQSDPEGREQSTSAGSVKASNRVKLVRRSRDGRHPRPWRRRRALSASMNKLRTPPGGRPASLRVQLPAAYQRRPKRPPAQSTPAASSRRTVTMPSGKPSSCPNVCSSPPRSHPTPPGSPIPNQSVPVHTPRTTIGRRPGDSGRPPTIPAAQPHAVESEDAGLRAKPQIADAVLGEGVNDSRGESVLLRPGREAVIGEEGVFRKSAAFSGPRASARSVANRRNRTRRVTSAGFYSARQESRLASIVMARRGSHPSGSPASSGGTFPI